MKAIERLYLYLELKGIRPTALEKEVGLSNGYLSIQRKRNADMGEAAMCKILDYCRQLSPIWLLTGVGDMECDVYQSNEKETKVQSLSSPKMYTDFVSKKHTIADKREQNSKECIFCAERERVIEGLENRIGDLKELIRTKEQLTGMLFNEIDRLKNMSESSLSKDDLAG